MKARNLIAKILKAQGVECVFSFPTNPLLEGAADENIRIVTGRTERHIVHMADGYARVKNDVGVCIVQGGPGGQHAFPGVAQAFNDSTPLLVLPGGAARSRWGLPSEFDPVPPFRSITKWAEVVYAAERIPAIFARAFTLLEMGRRRPVLLAVPGDVAAEELPDSAFAFRKVERVRTAADPARIQSAIAMIRSAENPVLFIGQGVLWAQATQELIAFAENAAIPVMTTILGKSAFPESHALALGSAGPAVTGMVEHFLNKADLVIAIGAGLTRTLASREIPKGKKIIQVSLDEEDINAEYHVDLAVLGDAKLVLSQLLEEYARFGSSRQAAAKALADDIAAVKCKWLESWMPKLTSSETPINPYRVVWELAHIVDRDNTIITHDSGMPREQLTPFYEATRPRGYLGWGNAHQLGSSLGLIMGAKLAAPDALAVHVLGDAGLATVFNDIETAVREKLPILTILLNNSTMAYYDQWIPHAIEKYRVTDVTGDQVAVAKALGSYAERITEPDEIAAAIKRGISVVQSGQPAVLEFVTCAENVISKWGATHFDPTRG
jgi:acetolactate synthase-1/2/3 large subunit